MRFREARIAKELSQNDLAYMAKVPQSQISRIETGKVWPCPAFRRRLSLALGVSERELFPEVFKEDTTNEASCC